MTDRNEGLDDAVAAAEAGLTPDGLTRLLRQEGHDVTVTALGVEAVGTGQMGSSYRLTPTYDGGAGELPATFVAKVAGGNPAMRGTYAGAYRTEINFYRELAASVAVRVPRCWHSSISEDGTEFVLLLDDLAPVVQGDQLAGCDWAAVDRAVANLAGLHGPRWCDPTLVGPLPVVTPDEAAMLGAILAPMTQMYLDRFGERIAPDDRAMLEQVPTAIGPWVVGRGERFGPVHGDYRLDNLMFAPGDGPVTALDWQTVSLGLPGRDLAYFCATSLTVEDRRAHEGEIVATYYDALLAHGVEDYPLDLCLEDYRFGLLQAPLVIVMGCIMAAATERGDHMFMAMTERAGAAIRDHDPFSLIAG